MRIRMAAMAAGVAAALALIGAAPAAAAPATVPMASGNCGAGMIAINFRNEGFYWAYADVWASNDRPGGGPVNEIDHDWSGTFGHGGGRILCITENAQHLYWIVRYDPIGNEVAHQWIEDWMHHDQKYCRPGEMPTIYVGGLPGNPDHFDLHCKKR